MKKLIPSIAAFFFAVFVLGVFAAMMFYSWQGLANIFPNDLLGQIFGMLMFDLAALIWFAGFVYLSRTISQYVIAFVGFLVGLAGTLGLIGIEVGISSGMLESEMMVKPLTYIFIGVLVGHVVLVYSHHASAPETAADISLGVEKAKITGRAEEEATRYLTENVQGLAQPIARELIKRVMEDLNLRPDASEVIDLPALTVTTEQAEGPAAGGRAMKDFLSMVFPKWGKAVRKYGMSAPNVSVNSKAATPKPSPAREDSGPEDIDDAKQNS